MKRLGLLLSLLAGAVSVPLLAQSAPEQAAPPVAQTPLAAAPASETCLPSTTLDELVKALDDAVSGAADRDRTCLKGLLLPEARFAPMTKAGDGTTPPVLTLDGWIDAVRKRGKMVFYERQVKVASDEFGHIAHLWSTYEIRLKPDGKAVVRGINSIQAVNDGTRWRVLEILWQEEKGSEPIPAKYLP
jgi:hypothetical protein